MQNTETTMALVITSSFLFGAWPTLPLFGYSNPDIQMVRPLNLFSILGFDGLFTIFFSPGIHRPPKSVGGGYLKNAREIRLSIFPDKDVPHERNTIVIMQWGQFVAHDTALSIPTTLTGMLLKLPGYLHSNLQKKLFI